MPPPLRIGFGFPGPRKGIPAFYTPASAEPALEILRAVMPFGLKMPSTDGSWGICMKTSALLISMILSCGVAVTPQSHWPKPPSPSVMNPAESKAPAPNSNLRVDPLQLQREARELSDLAKSLPGDMERVSRGLLPKDTIDKLKRIEKLSKHIKSELVP